VGGLLPPDAPKCPAGESNVTQVFVDPYTGRYLGQRSQLSGLVGCANQLHRMFANDGPKIQLSSLGHLIDPVCTFGRPVINSNVGYTAAIRRRFSWRV
jgi:hypothetical protein